MNLNSVVFYSSCPLELRHYLGNFANEWGLRAGGYRHGNQKSDCFSSVILELFAPSQIFLEDLTLVQLDVVYIIISVQSVNMRLCVAPKFDNILLEAFSRDVLQCKVTDQN